MYQKNNLTFWFVLGSSQAENSVRTAISSSPEDIKPVIQVDKEHPCASNLTQPPLPVLKALPAPEILQHNQPYSDFSRPSSLQILEDNKPMILPPNSSESVSCSAQSHLKLPSARAMHMDMRYSPYPRPAYPMSGMPSSFLTHPHGHMYPPYSVPAQAAYPPCQVSQSYPPCTANQQSFVYPATVSSSSMIGLASGSTYSELPPSLDLLGSADRTSGIEQRTT